MPASKATYIPTGRELVEEAKRHEKPARVRIVARGPNYTDVDVFVDGKPLFNVTKLEWSCEVGGESQAVVTLFGVEIEAEGIPATVEHAS